jgi:hypothetical protein
METNLDILQILLNYPLLSEAQLARLMKWRGVSLNYRLQNLRRLGWVTSLRGAEFSATPPPLYLDTVEGIKHLAAQEGLAVGEYAREKKFSSAYVAALALRRERVWALRELMLNLFQRDDLADALLSYVPQWQLTAWDVEIKLDVNELARSFDLFLTKRLPLVPLHGIICIARGLSDQCLLGFEYDTGRGPIAAVRERWEQLLEAHSYFPLFDHQFAESPLLMLLIAANEERLGEHLDLLRDLARHKHLQVPEGFFTTTNALPQLEKTRHAPIWCDLARALFECVTPQPLFRLLKPTAGHYPNVHRLWQRTPHRHDHPFAISRLKATTGTRV